MHSIYFFSYAALGTLAFLTVLSAQYTVYKREGAPFNVTLLKAIGGFAMSMYAGGFAALYAYAA